MSKEPDTSATRPHCDGCAAAWRTLFDAFLNDRGWVRLCAACAEPARGRARAYTGPYPILSPRSAAQPRHALRLIAGGATR